MRPHAGSARGTGPRLARLPLAELRWTWRACRASICAAPASNRCAPTTCWACPGCGRWPWAATRCANCRRALLSHSPRLRSLRLDGNRLESLPAALFAGVSGLRELRLSGNPGAPFALAPALRRTDAEPWAADPATVEARLPLGAPFAMRLALTVAGGEASAEELALAAGAVASGAVRVSGDGPVRVVLAAPAIPQTRCGNGPCFDGLAAEGSALALFATPPRVAGEVAPAELLGADAVRIDLSAHFAAGGGGALSYSATVDDPRLATALVDGAFLTVAANEDGEEGFATVTVVATDEAGQTATLRFQVEVSPRPPGNWRGWRSTIETPAAGQ